MKFIHSLKKFFDQFERSFTKYHLLSPFFHHPFPFSTNPPITRARNPKKKKKEKNSPLN